MPTYQYACTECGDRTEVVQRFSDDPLSVCGTCGGKLRKVFSPVGIVFKGSGFYRTDSRNGSVPASANGKGSGPDGAGSDGAGSDSNGSAAGVRGKADSNGKAETGASGNGKAESGSGASAPAGSGDKASSGSDSGSSAGGAGSSSKVA